MDTRFSKTALNTAILLALATGPLAHAAEGDAVGGMFQVNGLTATNQRAALWDGGNSVAMDANGDFVVVWTDQYGYDGETGGVFISRFAADGSALDGGDVQVNSVVTSNFQAAGAIAAAPDGRFVVTFLDYGSNAVYARLYAADGTPRGDEFQVSEGVALSGEPSAVTMAADGAFVIVWQEDLTTIKARRYDGDGSALDAAVTVASGSEAVEPPVVAMDPAGNYVIAWRQASATGTDIMVRRFLADGSALDATAFVVNTASSWGGYPDIAVDGSGNFVVVWQHFLDHDIYAKRFDADGNILNDEFLVFLATDYSGNAIYQPHVAMDAEGDFAVVATNYSGYNVYLQRYDSSASALYGSPIVADASNDNVAGSVAMDSDGDLVTAFTNYDGLDGSGYGVFAQRYEGKGRTVDLGLAGSNDASGALTPGDALTYSFTVTNSGSGVALGLSLADALPAGLSYTGFSSSDGWRCGESSGTVTCTFPVLASGASSSVDITVDTSGVTGSTIENSASVSSAVADANDTDNSDTVVTDTTIETDTAIESGAAGGGGAVSWLSLLTGLLLLRRRFWIRQVKAGARDPGRRRSSTPTISSLATGRAAPASVRPQAMGRPS